MVIVGRSPSSEEGGLGHVIDSFDTVVRLKRARTDPVNRGMKTTVVFSRSPDQAKEGIEFWYHPTCMGYGVYEWLKYQRETYSAKPSSGFCAILSAIHIRKPKQLTLIGFDFMLHPELQTREFGGHDMKKENAWLKELPVVIRDLYLEEKGHRCLAARRA